jgi:hypothetical protein
MFTTFIRLVKSSSKVQPEFSDKLGTFSYERFETFDVRCMLYVYAGFRILHG